MKNIEQLSAEELREILYKFYDILEHAITDDATLNRDNALDLVIDCLEHADEDHEAAKMAILFYSDLTLRLGKEVKILTLENNDLHEQINRLMNQRNI